METEYKTERALLRFVSERCEDKETANLLNQVWSDEKRLNSYLHEAAQNIICQADKRDIEMAVLSGKGFSEKGIAKIYNLTEKYVSLRLSRLYAKMIVRRKELLYGTLPYPFCVMVSIFSLTPLEAQDYIREYQDEKTDVRATTNYALGCLLERDEKVLEMYYGKFLSYHEIADRLNVTVERVRQVQNRGSRKLSKMFSKEIIIHGLRNYYKSSIEEEHAQMIGLAEMLAQNRIQEVARANKIDTEKIQKLQQEKTSAVFLKMTIDEFAKRYHLSPRTANCLRRHCIGVDLTTGQQKYITTIFDVVNMTKEQLMGVHNLGIKSYGEITAALNKVGLALRVKEHGYE